MGKHFDYVPDSDHYMNKEKKPVAWKKGDEISAYNLNSRNHATSWEFTQYDSESDYYYNKDFYLVDCGGDINENNPVIMYFNWNLSTWWGKSSDAYFHWNKITGKGGSEIGGNHNDITKKNTDDAGSLSISLKNIRETLGVSNATGWYRYSSTYGGSGYGNGIMRGAIFGYPCACKTGDPIRRYKNPDEGGYYTTPQELSADNLNSHTFGTYKE